MKRWFVLGSLAVAAFAARADILGTQEVAFIEAVLATNISTRGDGALYDLRGHGSVTLGDGSVAEYGSILELTEQDRRKLVGATAYLDGVAATNLAPLSPFAFGIRKRQPDGAVSVARLDYEPPCWVGGVEEVQKPAKASGGDKTVRVIHSAVLVSTNVSRSIQMESTYSLASLSRLSQRELSELRVDYGRRQMEFYKNGRLTQTTPLTNPDTRGCLARGVVRDEHGAPLARQPVKVVWSRPKRPIWDSDVEDVVEPVTTDGNGYFEKRLTMAAGAVVKIRKDGYVSLGLARNAEDFPIDIWLIPLPVGSGNVHTYGAPIRTKSSVSMKVCRSFGFCFDGYVSDGPYREYVMQGVTTNRAQADLWFEFGLSEQACMAQYEQVIGKYTSDLAPDLRCWPLKIVGLRGTEFKEAAEVPQDGLDMNATLREADATGYQTEGVRLARNEGIGYPRRPQRNDWSQNFYIRKNGRYGRLEGFYVSVGLHRVAFKAAITDVTWEPNGGCTMQVTNVGHRALVAASILGKEP